MKFDLSVVLPDEAEMVAVNDRQIQQILNRRYDLSVEQRRPGNWTPDGRAERAALRRDYRELTPAQRVEQVIELSRFMSQVAEAGHRRRLA